MISNLGPSTPVNRAAVSTGGIPMAPTPAPPTGPQDGVTLGQTQSAQAPPSNWQTQRGNNGVTLSNLLDQTGKANQAVVATLAAGPLVPAGITFKWSADSPTVTASLTDRPDVKLPQPSIADDGQIYLQLEPQGPGSNPAAPFLVFNPTTLAHGLSDGMRPDGQGGFIRGTQEYHNADGSYTIIADEHRAATGEKTFTRIDANQQGMKAADVTEKPVSQSARTMEQFASFAVLGPLAMLMPKKEDTGVRSSQSEAQVRPTPNGLEVTHPSGGLFSGFSMPSVPSFGQVGQQAGQIYNNASSAATDFNQNVSGKLGGSLKGMWDQIMGGGILGAKGYNVGQGFFNKKPAGAPTPPPLPQAPPQAPQAPPANISVVHPFTAAQPAALFPGLSALLSH